MTIGTIGTPACIAMWNGPFLNGPSGTLIAGYSANAFFQAQLRKAEFGPLDMAEAMTAVARSVAGAIEMQELLARAIGKWKGNIREKVQKGTCALIKEYRKTFAIV